MAQKQCGCFSGAFANERSGHAECRKMLHFWIRRGCIISTVSAETVRQSPLYCAAHKPQNTERTSTGGTNE